MLSIYFNVNAQDEKAIYIKYKTVKAVSENVQELEPEFKKGLKLYVDAVEEIEFEMLANDSIAVFMKKEKLDLENQNPLSKIIGNGIYYTNIKEKEKIKHVDMLGEKFNVLYPYDEYKWEITSETKMISGFRCYKAKTKSKND